MASVSTARLLVSFVTIAVAHANTPSGLHCSVRPSARPSLLAATCCCTDATASAADARRAIGKGHASSRWGCALALVLTVAASFAHWSNVVYGSWRCAPANPRIFVCARFCRTTAKSATPCSQPQAGCGGGECYYHPAHAHVTPGERAGCRAVLRLGRCYILSWQQHFLTVFASTHTSCQPRHRRAR
eukprot:1234974-Prymnesium_polylepis.1